MMVRALLGAGAIAAVVCALPARGGNPALTETAIGALTPVDSVPVPAALDQALPAPALTHLIAIARDGATDLGIQIRAIRALPAYCAQDCGTDAVHAALVELLETYAPASPLDPVTPADTLRLIAITEALGATRSGLAADFDRLWRLLDLPKPSSATTCAPRRDLRATAARAIGQLCVHAAVDALRAYIADPCVQVATQAGLAVQALEQCTK